MEYIFCHNPSEILLKLMLKEVNVEIKKYTKRDQKNVL